MNQALLLVDVAMSQVILFDYFGNINFGWMKNIKLGG
jgi:hypothetical protein